MPKGRAAGQAIESLTQKGYIPLATRSCLGVQIKTLSQGPPVRRLACSAVGSLKLGDSSNSFGTSQGDELLGHQLINCSFFTSLNQLHLDPHSHPMCFSSIKLQPQLCRS